MSFKLGSSYRRLIDAETTSCVYLDLSSQKLVLVYIEDLEGEVRDSRWIDKNRYLESNFDHWIRILMLIRLNFTATGCFQTFLAKNG